jgi:antitoxin component HigA of HigAB toxin-antitoxin module
MHTTQQTTAEPTNRHSRPWSRIATLSLLLVIIAAIVVTHTNEAQKLIMVHTKLAELSQIEGHLNSLLSQIKQTPPVTSQDIQALSAKVNIISTQLDDIKTTTQQSDLRSVISTSTSHLSEQLENLQKLTLSIKSRVSPQAYLPASVLPFEVVGIDLWNGDLKATLRSGGQLATPMSVSESRDGWRLMQLSTDPMQAIFQNNKGQKVLARVVV